MVVLRKHPPRVVNGRSEPRILLLWVMGVEVRNDVFGALVCMYAGQGRQKKNTYLSSDLHHARAVCRVLITKNNALIFSDRGEKRNVVVVSQLYIYSCRIGRLLGS